MPGVTRRARCGRSGFDHDETRRRHDRPLSHRTQLAAASSLWESGCITHFRRKTLNTLGFRFLGLSSSFRQTERRRSLRLLAHTAAGTKQRSDSAWPLLDSAVADVDQSLVQPRPARRMGRSSNHDPRISRYSNLRTRRLLHTRWHARRKRGLHQPACADGAVRGSASGHRSSVSRLLPPAYSPILRCRRNAPSLSSTSRSSR